MMKEGFFFLKDMNPERHEKQERKQNLVSCESL